jgi:hypothetical protein
VAAADDDTWQRWMMTHGRMTSALTWRPYDDVGQSAFDTWHDMAGPYMGHMAASGSATWHADSTFLASERANIKVTRVTTHRVTRGTR